MYIMTYTTAFLNAYGRYCEVNLDNRDRIGVLDTSDLVEETFTKAQFEELLAVCPNLNVLGVKHDGKTIKRLYGYSNNSHFLVGDGVCVHYEQKMDRGSYCTLKVYLKGTTCEHGCDLQIDTPHADGRYDWEFHIKGARQAVNGFDVIVSVRLRSKRSDYDLEDIVLNVDTSKHICDLSKFTTSEEVSMY